MKPEKNDNGKDIFRLIEIEKSIPCALEKADMICRKENRQLLSTYSLNIVQE